MLSQRFTIISLKTFSAPLHSSLKLLLFYSGENEEIKFPNVIVIVKYFFFGCAYQVSSISGQH